MISISSITGTVGKWAGDARHDVASAADTTRHGVAHAAQVAGHDVSHTAKSVGHDTAHLSEETLHDAGHAVHDAEDAGKEGAYYASTGVRMGYRAVAPGAKKDAPLSSAAKSVVAGEHVSSAQDVTKPADRAAIAWDGLKTNMESSTGLLDGRNGQPASAWTYGQTMVAAADQAKLTGNYSDFNKLAAGLKKYKSPGGGYCPGTNGVSGSGAKYYDDNAWIGLAFMQAANQMGDKSKQGSQYINDAKGVFNFLKQGVQPDGGLRWTQDKSIKPTNNTCDMGPAIELALQLHIATSDNPDYKKDPYFQFADKLNNYMEKNLLIKSGPHKGMYADHINEDGSRSNGICSYNQGTPIGANVLFYQITDQQKYLDQAKQTADASVNHYSKDNKLMKSSPAFNAIYLRNLDELNQVAPDPKYSELSSNYTNEVWNQSLDPESGLFDADSDMGRYGKKTPGEIDTLDQAGLSQLFSIQAMSNQQQTGLT